MQNKLGSFAEACANIAIGFAINFAANMLILPAFGFTSLTLEKNFALGVLYTAISLVRSYVLRRWFNGLRFGNHSEPKQEVSLVTSSLMEWLDSPKDEVRARQFRAAMLAEIARRQIAAAYPAKAAR